MCDPSALCETRAARRNMISAKNGYAMRLRGFALTASAAIVVLGVVCGATLYWDQEGLKSSLGLQSKPNAEIWSQLTCRMHLYLAKLRGAGPELAGLSWTELWAMTRPGIPFHCAEGTSIGASLRFSAFASESDRLAGAGIFHERCTACHGSDGSGGAHGPSLTQSNYEVRRQRFCHVPDIESRNPGHGHATRRSSAIESLAGHCFCEGIASSFTPGPRRETTTHPRHRCDQ